LAYREQDVAKGQKFLTKLWNASRFVGMHLDGHAPKEAPLELLDKWIISELHDVIAEGTRYFNEYKCSKTKARMENFFWHNFCDDYLEMVKHRLYNPDVYGDESKLAAQNTIYKVLLACLKVLAPIIPHITEEIYQEIFKDSEDDVSLHVSSWPKATDYPLDETSKDQGRVLKDTIASIRRYKADNGMPLNQSLQRVVVHAENDVRSLLKETERTIRGAMQIQEFEVTDKRIEAVEKVVDIVPDYSKLGPGFKEAAGKIVQELKENMVDVAKQIRDNGSYEMTVGGKKYMVLSEHIKEIKREIKGVDEGDLVDVPEHGITMLIVR
ncbi:MAG: class I tRNA ligase family protein, partial [Candidatus Hydrothermarchaeales archaeon]